MLRRVNSFLVVTLFFTILCGCAEDSPINANNAGNSGGDFTVTVSDGTTPAYSWTIGNAFTINVVRTANPTTIVWGVTTPGQNGIASPVTHGQVPGGAIEQAAVEKELESGVEYRVSVVLLDGSFGFTDFTP